MNGISVINIGFAFKKCNTLTQKKSPLFTCSIKIDSHILTHSCCEKKQLYTPLHSTHVEKMFKKFM